MRNTQATLYKIGRIINWVFLGLYCLGVFINIITLIVSAVNGWYIGDDISGIVTFTIFAALVLVLIILCGKFEEEAKKAPVNALAPVILLMVFGLVSGNVLYTVGGVFGIIAASQEKNGEKPEEKQEEKKEEKAE